MTRFPLRVKRNIPNIITSFRIIGTFLLLFLPPLTSLFFFLYTLCGISDAVDGWVARKTNTSSEFGAKLDSIADLLFYVLVILKLFPILWRLLPTWFWYIVGGIVIIRLISYLTAAIKFHRFASLHTKLNKITGASVFLLPYFLLMPFAKLYCFVVVGIATLSSTEELVLHISKTEYHSNMKGLF